MLRHNICMRPHSPVLQYITFYLPWLHWQKTNNSRTTPIPINPSKKPLSPGWCSAPCSPARGKTSISSVSYRWYIPKMILATWQMKVPLSSFLISVTSRLKEPEPWTGSLSLSVLVSVSMMTTVMIKNMIKKYPSPLCMKIALSTSMWCFLSMAGSPALLGSWEEVNSPILFPWAGNPSPTWVHFSSLLLTFYGQEHGKVDKFMPK